MSEVFQYDELDEATYHAHPALSVSTAKRLLEDGGPAKVHWEQVNGRKESKIFDLGHAAHKLTLGVGDLIVNVGADMRSKAAKEAAAEARAAGATPLTDGDWIKVHAMAEQLAGHKLAAELLQHGKPEVSMFATDTEVGISIRGRADYLRDDGVIVDYKTSADASPRGFTSSATKYGYDMQEAWYRELAGLCGLGVERFIFIVQEKEAPYLVGVYELDVDFQRRGRVGNSEARRIWATCQQTGHWPGYSEGIATLAPPEWAMRAIDNTLDAATEAAFDDFLKGFTHD